MQIIIKFDENGKILPFTGGKLITMDESPFLIFLASVGMCSAYYAKEFILGRNLSGSSIILGG